MQKSKKRKYLKARQESFDKPRIRPDKMSKKLKFGEGQPSKARTPVI